MTVDFFLSPPSRYLIFSKLKCFPVKSLRLTLCNLMWKSFAICAKHWKHRKKLLGDELWLTKVRKSSWFYKSKHKWKFNVPLYTHVWFFSGKKEVFGKCNYREKEKSFLLDAHVSDFLLKISKQIIFSERCPWNVRAQRALYNPRWKMRQFFLPKPQLCRKQKQKLTQLLIETHKIKSPIGSKYFSLFFNQMRT